MNKYGVEIFCQSEGVTRLGVQEVYAKDDIEAGRLAMIEVIKSIKDCTGVSVKRVHLLKENATPWSFPNHNK